MDQKLDPFDDALEDLRVTGSVVLHESYAPPWAIAVPDENCLRSLLSVATDTRVLVFHYVRRGEFELKVPGHPAVRVNTADVAICPSGSAHVMRRGARTAPVPLESIIRREAPAPGARDAAGATECVCGVFLVRAAPLNPLLCALPPIVKVATGHKEISPMLASVASMLATEIGRGTLNSFSTARLLELFCAETMRAYQRSAGTTMPGWFRGLADSRIADALGHIHAAPSKDWTVPTLARHVSLSPSRFAARFRETTGLTVMSYVARWRANVACRLLWDTDMRLGEIANRVGYDSLPAFSRAFKTQLGVPPAAWRASRRIANALTPTVPQAR